MAVVASVLVWLLIIVGTLLLLVVLMPLGLRASGAVGMDAPWGVTGELNVRWAWGLLGVRVARGEGAQLLLLGFGVARVRGAASEEKREKKKEKKRARKERKKGRRRKRGVRWALGNRRLFARLLRGLHLRGALRGTIGLGDPADTADVALLVRPVVEWLPWVEARLDWDYVDEVLDLEGTIQARIWPAELVAVFVTALVRGRSRRALLATSR